MSVRILAGIGGSALQLKPYRAARSNPINGRYNRAAYSVPSASLGEREGELKMDKEKETRPHTEQQHDQSKAHAIRDAMTDSFGEGYSTRSDEDGFGCIYGSNDLVNHPEYDKSQGSEVKEKEKARNLKQV